MSKNILRLIHYDQKILISRLYDVWATMEYLCLLDESESYVGAREPFFVSGGLLIPFDKVRPLHSFILSLVDQYDIPSGCPLKWNNPSGSTVPPEALRKVKQQLLEGALTHSCRLFVSVVHKRIAETMKRKGEAHTYGLNSVLNAIDNTLCEEQASALFLIDRQPAKNTNDSFNYLADKMSQGLRREAGQGSFPQGILGFGFVTSKSTRLASTLDFSLGAFTRCLDERSTTLRTDVGATVARLLARRENGSVWERGLVVRPLKRIVFEDYAQAYVRALQRLASCGLTELSNAKARRNSGWEAGWKVTITE